MSSEPTQIVYFGDSLTDVDVIYSAAVEALTAQILPILLAPFGPTPLPAQIAAAEQQAALLAEQQAQIQLAPFGFGPFNAITNEVTHAVYSGEASGSEILNYANAGARALGSSEPFGPGTGYDSNLGAQIDRFVADSGAALAPGASAVLFIGSLDLSDVLTDPANDTAFELVAAATATVGALLDRLETAARTLTETGVETVYFGTLPSAGFYPGFATLDSTALAIADVAVSVYNGLLATRADALGAEGLDVQIIDYAAVARAVLEDPEGFGIVADYGDFLDDGSAFDADQVAFWDEIHPAEAVHQAWGAYAAFVMEGGSTSSLSDFGTISLQTGGDNAVFANGGNDTVFGFGGDDIVFGGTGNDHVYAGGGNDIASGGSSDDNLRGQSGEDIVAGGAGDDTLRGNSGDDVLIDGRGDDLCYGGWGDDTFVYVQATLEGDMSRSEDAFRGGRGDDVLYLVLDAGTFGIFETQGASAVLADLGVSVSSVETIMAIDGRTGVEPLLSDEDWFRDADFWGLVPAPSSPVDLIA